MNIKTKQMLLYKLMDYVHFKWIRNFKQIIENSEILFAYDKQLGIQGTPLKDCKITFTEIPLSK